jgi:organic hydroperoxide reductase OsmC/OhrA
MAMKVLYTAEAVIEGGREGRGETSDGRLSVDLSVPEEMGGTGGPGTNPEQLFALGYAACFQSALLSVARGKGTDIAGSKLVARVVSAPPGRAASAWPSASTCTGRALSERRPRRSWPVRTSSAPTPAPPATTSTSPSWSTARH